MTPPRTGAVAGRVAREPESSRSRDVSSTGSTVLHFLWRFGLVIACFMVLVVFSIWKPSSFFTCDNFKATFTSQAVVLMVALGAMVPLIVGEFDLSVGANAGLGAIFAVGFCDMQHIAPGVSILLAVLICTGVGVLNGLIVTRLKVNSFVATLGVGTAIAGFG